MPKSQPRNVSNKVIVRSDSAELKAKDFTLIWSDEFDKDGSPDTTSWSFEKGFVRNTEAQWYQQENATCLDGNLVISAKKERKANPEYVLDSKNWRYNRKYIEYTSASLKQKKTFAFKYGRVLVRAKIIASQGLWPAIWTLGVSGIWPYNGECDIMEYYKGGLHANFAHGSLNPEKPIWNGAFKKMESFDNTNWDQDFHIWRLDWCQESMEIYVDDLLLNSVKLSEMHNLTNGSNPFQQPHYLLLNLALGGDNGGDLSKTHFPSKYLVDYVRVYQVKTDQ
ncbi:glycoside hydrolase family 16 protein [Pedobacter arcticus]|uniref:glycoside hydrolase family 16 protein n=1 Tax=Pedobacter arcticus TaxID=752140 RepID=UPI0002F85F64|nr:glycoside hydrolase family 16 protein [Pedobacter arcticus]